MARLPAHFEQALALLLDGLEGADFAWALTGSAGLALSGMNLEPRDIDLQTDKEGAYAIEARFDEAVTRPLRWSEAETIRSHFGALEIAGVKVEVMGDVEKRRPDGSWGEPPYLPGIIRHVPYQGRAAPVIDPAYELTAYRAMGREARAAQVAALLAAGTGAGAAEKNLPLLHVVGDSISMHYGPYLEPLLMGRYRYSRKLGVDATWENANGGDSSMVLAYLRERIEQAPAVDLLLVNCGLHDLKRDPDTGAYQVPLEQYRANLTEMLNLAAARSIPLVWARTTPVYDELHNSRSAAFRRYAADVEAYNAAADVMMAARGVPVIDLYALTRSLGPGAVIDHVHFCEEARARQAAYLAGWLAGLRALRGDGVPVGTRSFAALRELDRWKSV